MKKKILFFSICTFILTFVLSLVCFAYSGDGSMGNPYVIDSQSSLQVSGNYVWVRFIVPTSLDVFGAHVTNVQLFKSDNTRVYPDNIQESDIYWSRVPAGVYYFMNLPTDSDIHFYGDFPTPSPTPPPTPTPAPTPDPYESTLNTFGGFISSGSSSMGTIVQFIYNNSIIIVPLFLFFVIGGVIAIVKRIKNK